MFTVSQQGVVAITKKITTKEELDFWFTGLRAEVDRLILDGDNPMKKIEVADLSLILTFDD